MIGTIRTKEKCPKCGEKFVESRKGLQCPECKTTPRRYFLDIPQLGSKNRKLYSDSTGHPFDSFERADQELSSIRTEIRKGTFDACNYVKREIKALQFSTYIELWLERREREYHRHHITKSYLKSIREYVRNYYIPFFKNRSIRDIRDADIIDFRDQLPLHLSAKTVANILGSLHKFFQDAFGQRKDIALMPQFPRVTLQEPTVKWITQEEQERILKRVKDPLYRAFYLFLAKQGCRPSEARALRWEMVDLRHNLVTIAAGFDMNQFKPYTKEKDVRVLPLHPEVQEAIQRLPRSITGFVFVNRHGRPLSARRVYEIWSKAAALAGIKVTCYQGTRHSLASQAVNDGVSLEIIGGMLGHKNPMSTKKYAKLRPEAFKQMWRECPQSVPGNFGDKDNLLKFQGE
jgi:integrase